MNLMKFAALSLWLGYLIAVISAFGATYIALAPPLIVVTTLVSIGDVLYEHVSRKRGMRNLFANLSRASAKSA